MKINATNRATGIEYAIRDVVLPARKLEEQGEKVLRLNIGDPLQFDFDTPIRMKEGFKGAIDEGKNHYGPSEGIPELRDAIAKREREKNNADIFTEDVLVTTGVSEGLHMLFGSLLDSGDELLVPGPSYPPYIALSEFYGGKPISYETMEEENWQPNIDDLRSKITDKTKAIVIINPNNPTGALYGEGVLKKVVSVAKKAKLPIISDEIYDEMTYEGEHVGLASLSGNVPTIVLNGFSKIYLATGWRMGYMYFSDTTKRLESIKEGIKKMGRLRLCPNTPAQYGVLEGLRGDKDYLSEVMEKLASRRDYFYNRIKTIPGLSATKPQGAFYIFPKIEGDKGKDDKEFILELLRETKVLFVHGSGFDPNYGSGHFRSVFLAKKEILEKALNRIERFMKDL